MSGLLAIFGRGAEMMPEPLVARMLDRMDARGGGDRDIARSANVVLAVTRPEWQQSAALGGDAIVTRDGSVTLVCDAAIYYRADLRQRLAAAGVAASVASPAQCILAAYRAFGNDLAEHLEGEFAFALWDAERQVLLASRDASGVRALYVGSFAGLTIIASTIGAITAHPLCPTDYDVRTLGCDAAALIFSAGDGSVYQAIRAFPTGVTLEYAGAGRVVRHAFWPPRVMPQPSARTLPEAAEELQVLLRSAVRERMPEQMASAVWMSGGYDSPSLAAVARTSDRRELVQLISASYPEGHSARENERITEIAARLELPVTWVEPELLARDTVDGDGSPELADEPFRHLYSQLIHHLSEATQARGTRVALNGHGGDFLFQCGLSFMGDLFRRGRWVELAGELQVFRGMLGFKGVVKHAIEPALSRRTRAFVGRVRGRPLALPFERLVPSWIDARFARREQLAERTRSAVPDVTTKDQSSAEFWWYQTNPGFARFASRIYEAPLAHGVELRSPFHDLRLARWAAAGPRNERYARGEEKRVLREAMRPLLPSSAVTARLHKAGTLASTLETMLETAIPRLRQLFTASMLGDLGIVDVNRFRSTLDGVESYGCTIFVAEQLVRAGMTEAWLQQKTAQGNVPVQEVSCGFPDLETAR